MPDITESMPHEAGQGSDALRFRLLFDQQRRTVYPKVLWQPADAMAGDGLVPAGRPMTVEDSYRAALGC